MLGVGCIQASGNRIWSQKKQKTGGGWTEKVIGWWDRQVPQEAEQKWHTHTHPLFLFFYLVPPSDNFKLRKAATLCHKYATLTIFNLRVNLKFTHTM